MENNEYIIRNHIYTEEQIRKMTFDSWAVERSTIMPKSLFKYYSNVIEKDDMGNDRNYSIEALENNTVFLQSPNNFDDVFDCSIVFDENEYSYARLKYYEKLCGFHIDETDPWKYIYLLSKSVYDRVIELQAEGLNMDVALKRIFHVREDGTSIDMTHTIFAQIMYIELMQNYEKEDAWQIAFRTAINNEIKHIKKMLSENFRIACFTTAPYKNRMWGHYANNHKGFCVEYEIPEYSKENDLLFCNLFPVIYSNVRTSVLPECLKFMEDKNNEVLLEKIYKYGVLTKSMDWKDQDEWRLVSMGNMLAKDYNCTFFKIRKVFIGNRMPKDERKRVMEICKRKGITYSGIIFEQDKYELTECSGDCMECNKVR